MEEIRIGVIGTGRIGVEHIRRINTGLSGARVTAVASSTPARAGEVAARFAIPHAMEAETLIASPGVDAVMITSPGASHEAYALACLRARKPVFCEKPLAMTAEAGLSVVRAECAVGRQLIQLGFMRRFDQHHLELRQLLAGGSLGRALMVHATHRNPNNANFNDTMEIVDTAIHELDALPWLLGDPVVSCQALYGAAASCIAGQQHDPMLLLLRTASGVLIDLEVFTHCQYGFDISCEVVCEQGAAALPPSTSVMLRRSFSRSVREYDVWQERYAAAFDRELQHFIDGVRCGVISGPSAWDGYSASLASEACLRSLKSGQWEPVIHPDRPSLYSLSS